MGVEAGDSDHLVERRLGTSIEDYFGSHGERAFREQEEEAVCELLEAPPCQVLSLGGGAVRAPRAPPPRGVVAGGGGAPPAARVRAPPARHTVVLLDVDVETAW